MRHLGVPLVLHRSASSVVRLPVLALAVAASLLCTGCGEEGNPQPKKIDVSAQVAALKGNADAKGNALAELAAGGPNSVAAAPQVIPLLKDEDPVIRRLAAYALGQMGPDAKAALPDLKALLQDNDRNVVTAAMNALRAIQPSKEGDVAIPNTMSESPPSP